MPTEIEALLTKEDLAPAERDTLRKYHLSVAPELAKARAEIDKLRKAMPDYPTTLVFRERPASHPRPTFFHRRGEFLRRGERVEPAVPAVLHPLPEGPANRLTFARWLVDPGNPLVGRVVMNRHWAAFFGRGIVRTTGDFGLQGDPPTHPELLDWLALEFVRSGWSVKRMHRLIVTSATYRQSSRVTPGLLRRDPDNELLARGPRHRLEAELVRDTALAACGLLSRKVGGPSVFPAQPPGVTTEGTYGKLKWKVSPGPDRHRRGLYTFSKRTAPFAMTAAFDAPSGEACIARRERSNTPLQALTLLNGPTFVEVTRALGRLTAERRTSESEKVRFLFRRCLTRPPDGEEVEMLLRFYRTQQRRLMDKERAEALAGPGPDVRERAAWTAIARVLLNLDETIVKE
jgi:hypothetical protein